MSTLAPLLLAGLPDVAIPAYWFALILGGGLILISTLFGGTSHSAGGLDAAGTLSADLPADADLGGALDAHADVGVGHDAGAGHDVGADAPGALALSRWFSLSFATYALAVFGAVGVVLCYVAGWSASAALPYAVVGGVAVGQGVHQLLRKVRATSGNSTTAPQDYVNRVGRVTVAIRHPDIGEAVLNVRGTARYVPAAAGRAGTEFEVGDEVVVRAYRAGVVEVVGRRDADSPAG